jgi:YqaJ-like viral recombinase domain
MSSQSLLERVTEATKKRKRDPSLSTTLTVSKRNRRAEPYPSKEEQTLKVLAFEAKHGAIRQGTSIWYESMKESVGGSEASSVLDKNQYTTRDELIKKKRNPSDEFVQHVPCMWGNLFEPVIRRYAEVEFDTQIYCYDICILDGRLRYSPDGIGVVSRRKGGNIFDIVLFEFKCPYIRMPKGIVPEQYEVQIWTGLAATGEIETAYAMYVDAVFRKCSQDQLDETPDYDRQYHLKGCPSYGKPSAYGVMNVYSKRADDAGGKPVDYGAAVRDVFDGMLKDVDNGVLFTSLVYIKFTDDRADILGPQGHIDGMYHSGIIPFKIMRVIFKKVKPIPNFGEHIAAEVNKFFEDVNKQKE